MMVTRALQVLANLRLELTLLMCLLDLTGVSMGDLLGQDTSVSCIVALLINLWTWY